MFGAYLNFLKNGMGLSFFVIFFRKYTPAGIIRTIKTKECCPGFSRDAGQYGCVEGRFVSLVFVDADNDDDYRDEDGKNDGGKED